MSLLTVSKIQKETSSTNIDVPSTGQFIDLASAAQGDVLYYNGTSYVRLAPGTSGQHLQTAGAAANPIWGDAGGGKVLQVVQTVKTDTASTTAVTTSLVDITDMTVDITPAATTSKVLVFWNVNLCAIANRRLYIRLAQVISSVETYPLIGDTAGSRTRVTSQGSPSNAQGMANISVQYLASPATVSTVTYKLQWSANVAGTTYLNRSETDTDSADYTRQTSSITVMEIGA